MIHCQLLGAILQTQKLDIAKKMCFSGPPPQKCSGIGQSELILFFFHIPYANVDLGPFHQNDDASC
jgi:hypothetical protein